MLANNSFAVEKADTLYRLDSVENKYAEFMHDFDSYQQLTKKIINELNKNASENFQLLNKLGVKHGQLVHDFDIYQQETRNTISKMNAKDNGQAKIISSLTVKHNQLSQEFSSYQQTLNNKIGELDNKDNEYAQLINNLEERNNQLLNDFKIYVQKTAKEVKSMQASIVVSDNNISKLHRNTTSQQKTYFVVAISLNILLFMIVFIHYKKQLKLQQDIFTLNHDDICKLREERVGLDQKLTDIIETQLKVLESRPVKAEEEPNHSLALKVADEIVRIHKNISRMDKKTKGLKQLSASVKRIQDNFASNGYELVEMLGQPYNEGMKVQANFIPDDELEDGQEVITRIIKPQVNYKGEMIQSAQIEVSQG